MASGFEYKGTPIEAYCSSYAGILDAYYSEISSNNYLTNNTNKYCKKNSLLNGIWASESPEFTDNYLYKESPMNFCKLGYAPVPIRNENSTYTNVIQVFGPTSLSNPFQIKWLNEGDKLAYWGAGVYILDKDGNMLVDGLQSRNISFISKSPVIIVDVNAPGGGGGSGSHGSNIKGNRYPGGGGGSGAFGSFIVDIKKQGGIYVEGCRGGSGGVYSSNGGNGDDTFVYVGTSPEENLKILTLGGGGGGTLGSYANKSGTGGDRGTVSQHKIDGANYTYVLCTYPGLDGAVGDWIDADDTGKSDDGPSFKNTKRKFGDLAELTVNIISGGKSIVGDIRGRVGPGGAASAMGRGGYGGGGKDSDNANASTYYAGGEGFYGGGGGGGCGTKEHDTDTTFICDGGKGGNLGLRIFSEKQSFSANNVYKLTMLDGIAFLRSVYFPASGYQETLEATVIDVLGNRYTASISEDYTVSRVDGLGYHTITTDPNVRGPITFQMKTSHIY